MVGARRRRPGTRAREACEGQAGRGADRAARSRRPKTAARSEPRMPGIIRAFSLEVSMATQILAPRSRSQRHRMSPSPPVRPRSCRSTARPRRSLQDCVFTILQDNPGTTDTPVGRLDFSRRRSSSRARRCTACAATSLALQAHPSASARAPDHGTCRSSRRSSRDSRRGSGRGWLGDCGGGVAAWSPLSLVRCWREGRLVRPKRFLDDVSGHSRHNAGDCCGSNGRSHR